MKDKKRMLLPESGLGAGTMEPWLMNPTLLNPGCCGIWDYYSGERKVINQHDIPRFFFLAEPRGRVWQERIVLYVGAFGIKGAETHLDNFAAVLTAFP